MWTLSAPFLAPMAGLLVFAGLLLAGVRLLRWLKLVGEPPMILQFEPPPPSAFSADDANLAARVAERRRLSQQCADAWRSYVAWQQIVGVQQQLADIPEAMWRDSPAQTGAKAKELIDRTAAIAEQAQEQARSARLCTEPESGGICTAARETAEGAVAEVEALIKDLPEPGNKRLILLLVLLIVALAWSAAMLFALPTSP